MRVLFLTASGQLLDYRTEGMRQYINKFLVWEGLIVASELSEHRDIRDGYVALTGEDPGKPVGAGRKDPYSHLVASWHSGGLESTTPDSLRPVICEALGLEEWKAWKHDYRSRPN